MLSIKIVNHSMRECMHLWYFAYYMMNCLNFLSLTLCRMFSMVYYDVPDIDILSHRERNFCSQCFDIQ